MRRFEHSLARRVPRPSLRQERRARDISTSGALDAERLHLVPGRAILIVDSINVTMTGTPIMTSRARFAADRVELVVES